MTNRKEQKNLEDELKEIRELPIYPRADEEKYIGHYINLAWEKLMELKIKIKDSPDFEKVTETAYIITKRLLNEGKEFYALWDYPTAYQTHFDIFDKYPDLKQCITERLKKETDANIIDMLEAIQK